MIRSWKRTPEAQRLTRGRRLSVITIAIITIAILTLAILTLAIITVAIIRRRWLRGRRPRGRHGGPQKVNMFHLNKHL